MKDYYKAYEKRYEQVHEKNMLWSSTNPSKVILEFLEENNVTKESKILELGCGEGRDAIFLLNKGYNVLAVDYSKAAIDKCKELSDNKFNDNFRNFDLFTDELHEKFDFIYSVSVLHMFVLKEHRDKYWNFIKKHLKYNGKAIISVLGDGKEEFSTDITKAFDNTKRVVLNNDAEIEVVSTSCKIVKWDELEKEIKDNNLILEKKWISDNIPEFNPSMCVIVKR